MKCQICYDGEAVTSVMEYDYVLRELLPFKVCVRCADGQEVNEMVERTETQSFDEFEGYARKIETVNSNYGGVQVHIEIEPADKTILKQSKTGRFHEFIRLPPKATDTSVPEGSVIDQYLKEVEATFREAKKEETVQGALRVLLEKKVLYRKKKLGKAFKGFEASEHWVPNRYLG